MVGWCDGSSDVIVEVYVVVVWVCVFMMVVE